jgi:hypothetical protein
LIKRIAPPVHPVKIASKDGVLLLSTYAKDKVPVKGRKAARVRRLRLGPVTWQTPK